MIKLAQILSLIDKYEDKGASVINVEMVSE
jgi:hypothetical protein